MINNLLLVIPKWCAVSLLILMLSGCSTAPVQIVDAYSSKEREHLYKLVHWEFEGRLAIAGNKDSWSANIFWEHISADDKLKLAGPLGQGAVIIQLSGNNVMIDRGNGDVRWSERPEEFINKEVGMFVPVKSLRYWVVGLPMPAVDFQEMGRGFKQSGWVVEYKQMQSVKGQLMPRKIAVSNDELKLTLVIDHWDFGDVETK